jgi:sporulation protein YlmC with PRC-barrel domain
MANPDDTANPSGPLVAARQVQGTDVYDTTLEKLGSVADVMIDKTTGRVAYALLSHGGFLGIGDHHYRLPWDKMSYNTEIGGYIVDLDRDALEAVPSGAG